MLFIMRAVIKKNTIQNVNVRIEFPLDSYGRVCQ